MKTVFVIHNSEGTFLGKQGQWLAPVEAQAVWRSPHHDVALNQMIEANAREIMLRLQIMSCPLSERDVPLLDQAVVPKKMSAIQFDEPEGEVTVETADDEDAEIADQQSLDWDAPAADTTDLPASDNPDNTETDKAAAQAVSCETIEAAAVAASDAANVTAPEFAQTTAEDLVVIAGELETKDYSISTER